MSRPALLLLVLLAGLVAAANASNAATELPLPDDQWPASIKYTAAPCSASEAHTLFLRRPFGCNPTFAGPGLENQSWYAVCEDESTTWTVDYFTGLTCSAYDRTEFAPTPSACDLNLKDEYEREFCFAKTLPDEVDPFGAGAGLYGAVGSLHSDASCSEPGFFMYIYRALDLCITEGAESYVWREQGGALFIDNYSNLDCSGAAAVAGSITPGSCLPFGPSAWASLITVPEPTFPTQAAAGLTTLALIKRRSQRRRGGKV